MTVALTQPPGSELQTSTATATPADDVTRTIPSDLLFFSKGIANALQHKFTQVGITLTSSRSR